MNNPQETTQPQAETSKTKEFFNKLKSNPKALIGSVALGAVLATGATIAHEATDGQEHESTTQVTPSPEQTQAPAAQKIEPGTVLVDAPNERRQPDTEPTQEPKVQPTADTHEPANSSHDESEPKEKKHRSHVINHPGNDIVLLPTEAPSPEPTPPVVEVTPTPSPTPENPVTP